MRRAGPKLEAGGPLHFARVSVCDGSHSPCLQAVPEPIGCSQVLSSLGCWYWHPCQAGRRVQVTQCHILFRAQGQRATRHCSFLESADFCLPPQPGQWEACLPVTHGHQRRSKVHQGPHCILAVYQLFGSSERKERGQLFLSGHQKAACEIVELRRLVAGHTPTGAIPQWCQSSRLVMCLPLGT